MSISLVAPIVAGVSSLLNTGASIYNTNRTNRANRELAEYSYSKDLEMYNMNNAYNSPQAQMDRLTNAGLNPNLVYGNGSVTGNTSGQLPKYQAPTQNYNYQAPNALGVLSAFADLKIKSAQYDSLQQDVEAKKINNFVNSTTQDYAIASKQYGAENLFHQTDINFTRANTERINNQILSALNNAGVQVSIGKQQLANLIQDNLLKFAQTQNTKAQLPQYQANAKTAQLDMGIREIESKFMHGAGVRGSRDLLPFIQTFLRGFGK